jgi:hypothetical protein
MTRMNKYISAHPTKSTVILIACLTAVYFLIVILFGYYRSLNLLMFSSRDAQLYGRVAEWIIGNENLANLSIKPPFLYPLILVIAKSVANNFGIWGIQFIFWVASGGLLYWCIYKNTNNSLLAIGGVVIYAGNITLLLLTFHALTEVTTVFLLGVLVYLILEKQNINTEQYTLLTVLMVSLLTVMKPVFLILWTILLAYRIPLSIRDAIRGRIKWSFFAFLILTLLPVLIQIAIMKTYLNEYTISNIGSITFKNYFFARLFGQENTMTIDQARVATNAYSQLEMIKYILSHAWLSIKVYTKTLLDNFLSRSDFINQPVPNIYLFVYMRLVNIMYFTVHVEMIPLIIAVLIDRYRKRYWADIETIISLLIPLLIIFLSAGITFSQGDRIILPGLPIWIVLYSVIFSKYQSIKRTKYGRIETSSPIDATPAA